MIDRVFEAVCKKEKKKQNMYILERFPEQLAIAGRKHNLPQCIVDIRKNIQKSIKYRLNFQHDKPRTMYVHYSLRKTDLPLLLAVRLIYLHTYLPTVELDDEKSDENTIHVVGNSSRGKF